MPTCRLTLGQNDSGGLVTRRIVVIGVPSNIGIKPYDDGRPRGVDRAPTTLREQGVVERLSARDDGDVLPAPYRDFTRPHGRPRNDEELLDLTRRLSSRVARAVGAGEFPLVLGGDCSVVLGALAGLRRAGISRPGLVYLDAHADFATPEESKSGSVASMCLGLAVGRGQTILSALADTPALVLERHVALVGRRDDAEPWYGQRALRSSAVLDLPDAQVQTSGYLATAGSILERVGEPPVDGFWIHVDADVLTPDEIPAVDSPLPGGPCVEELGALVAALVAHPQAKGLELTIFDPLLDEGERGAGHLVRMLTLALAPLIGAGRVSDGAT